MAWTKQGVKRLKALIAEGMSASQIAEALGGGLTRNAVIGKCHRLGLTLQGGGQAKPGRASDGHRLPRRVAAKRPRLAGSRAGQVILDEVGEFPSPAGGGGSGNDAPGAVRFADRRPDQCANPLPGQRSGPDMLVCGAPAMRGDPSILRKPYCRACGDRLVLRPTDRRRARRRDERERPGRIASMWGEMLGGVS